MLKSAFAKTTLGMIVVAGAIGLSGCDVKKTEEGHAQLPKYDVEKKQSADVKLPKYDVTTPDVTVGSKKETIEVPTVGVKTAKEKEQEQAARQMGSAGAASSPGSADTSK